MPSLRQPEVAKGWEHPREEMTAKPAAAWGMISTSHATASTGERAGGGHRFSDGSAIGWLSLASNGNKTSSLTLCGDLSLPHS